MGAAYTFKKNIAAPARSPAAVLIHAATRSSDLSRPSSNFPFTARFATSPAPDQRQQTQL